MDCRLNVYELLSHDQNVHQNQSNDPNILQKQNCVQPTNALYDFYLINDTVCMVGSLKARVIISVGLSYGPVIEKTAKFQIGYWIDGQN